jgi:HAD superfamily hydrolase (TIGR01484 family)
MKPSQLVLAVDLDGTLLLENHRMHPQDVALLKQGLPLTFIFATGRSLPGVRRPLLQNGLLNGGPINFPLVIHNGALTFLPGEELHTHILFPLLVHDEIIQVSLRHPEATFLFQGERQVWQLWETPAGARGVEMYGFEPHVCNPDEMTIPGFSKWMCLSEQKNVLDIVASELAGLAIEGNYSLSNIYEATPQGVDKALGLKNMMSTLALQDARLIVIGDGDNDIGMFALADRTYAPAHAREHVRRAVDFIIDPAEHGLLRPVLERELAGVT